MPWAAIPLGRHTALPPAVKNLTQQGPEFRNGIPALLRHARLIVMPGPDRASLYYYTNYVDTSGNILHLWDL
jgi:hypothetical protein